MALLDNKKAIVIMRLLMVLFLGFSYIHFSAFVASTNIAGFNMEDLMSSNMEVMPIPNVLAQETVDARSSREEIPMEGRMDIESNDYPGTGANNHHDPRPPARD